MKSLGSDEQTAVFNLSSKNKVLVNLTSLYERLPFSAIITMILVWSTFLISLWEIPEDRFEFSDEDILCLGLWIQEINYYWFKENRLRSRMYVVEPLLVVQDFSLKQR